MPAVNQGYSADHARPEVEEHRAGNVLAVKGLVVKHIDATEVRIAVAAVIAAAANAVYAVLVANHLQKLGAHLVTARPVEEISWMQETRRRKNGGGAETLPKQLIYNSAVLEQERGGIRLYVYSGKLILAAMNFQ
jgi:hypothetical protein